MGGPWEDYGGPSAEESGPWDDYASPQGKRYDPDTIDAVRKGGHTQAAILQGLQGFFGEYSDEMGAGMRAAAGGKYKEELKKRRDLLDETSEQYPITSLGSKLLGFVASPIARYAGPSLKSAGLLSGAIGLGASEADLLSGEPAEYGRAAADTAVAASTGILTQGLINRVLHGNRFGPEVKSPQVKAPRQPVTYEGQQIGTADDVLPPSGMESRVASPSLKEKILAQSEPPKEPKGLINPSAQGGRLNWVKNEKSSRPFFTATGEHPVGEFSSSPAPTKGSVQVWKNKDGSWSAFLNNNPVGKAATPQEAQEIAQSAYHEALSSKAGLPSQPRQKVPNAEQGAQWREGVKAQSPTAKFELPETHTWRNKPGQRPSARWQILDEEGQVVGLGHTPEEAFASMQEEAALTAAPPKPGKWKRSGDAHKLDVPELGDEPITILKNDESGYDAWIGEDHLVSKRTLKETKAAAEVKAAIIRERLGPSRETPKDAYTGDGWKWKPGGKNIGVQKEIGGRKVILEQNEGQWEAWIDGEYLNGYSSLEKAKKAAEMMAGDTAEKAPSSLDDALSQLDELKASGPPSKSPGEPPTSGDVSPPPAGPEKIGRRMGDIETLQKQVEDLKVQIRAMRDVGNAAKAEAAESELVEKAIALEKLGQRAVGIVGYISPTAAKVLRTAMYLSKDPSGKLTALKGAAKGAVEGAGGLIKKAADTDVPLGLINTRRRKRRE